MILDRQSRRYRLPTLATMSAGRLGVHAPGDRRARRLVAKAADAATQGLQRCDIDARDLPVTTAHVSVALDLTTAPGAVSHVLTQAARLGVVCRAYVYFNVLAANALEQYDVLVAAGFDDTQAPRLLWGGGVRPLLGKPDDVEPFVDRRSLELARAIHAGRGDRGPGGLLVDA